MTRPRPDPPDPMTVLYEAHGRELYRYLVGMIGQPTDAEDVLQTVWSRLAGRLGRPRDPGAYLWRTARHEALRWLRRAGRKRRREQGLDGLEMLPEALNPGVSREERLALAAALRTLPFEQREAVVLLAFEGRTAREAAECIGAAESTVASRYRLAVVKLKRKLTP